MSQPELPEELSAALAAQRGFLRGESYLLMSLDVYRDIMGIASDEELNESLTAIEETLGDCELENPPSLEQVFRDLDGKFGMQR